jgi:hypothetical protein
MRPWTRIDAGLFGSAVPARKSGSSPDPKIKSCEILRAAIWIDLRPRRGRT